MTSDDDSTLQGDSVHSLIGHWARDARDSPFLLSARDERRLTYIELRERIASWLRVFRSSGIDDGARIGLLIADPIDFAIAFLAVLSDGSWAAPLDPTLDVNDTSFERRIANLHLDVVVSDRVAPTSVHIAWIAANDDTDPKLASAVNPAPTRSGGLILSSSGTTGTPKVIALAERQLVHAAKLIAEHNRLSVEERGFNPLPLWHINAEVVGLLATLVAGASLVLDDRFHRTDFWPMIDRFDVTWVNAVPAIISRIATLNDRETVPSRLRFVRSASAPLSPSLMSTFEANTGVAIIESYGMTEAASQICVNPLEGPRKIGSVGPPAGVELRLTPFEDSDPHAVTPDVASEMVGHVEIRGASVITSYDAQGYEDRFDAEGWLTTGDLGYLDDDGYLFLVGRSDDVINRGGEKIFPREIEDVVLAVLDVGAAAVVGVPDEVFGQVPVLYVQFTSAANRNLEERVGEIGAVLTSSFARAHRPVRIVVVDSFPAHATGKIQKKSLTEHDDYVLMRRDLV